MTNNPPSSSPPSSGGDKNFKIRLPVAGKLRLRFPSFEALVNRLSRHIAQDGMFIPTENPKSAGTLLALEIGLQDGDIILEAEGEVLWNRKATTPQEPSGMGFRFINLSEASQKFVWRVAHMNLEAGIPPAVILESTDIIIDSATGEEIIPESLFRKSAPTPAVSPIPTPVASMAKNGPQKKSLLTDSVETAVTSVEGGPVIGIDFGTCNSCVAFMDGETSKLIPTDKGGLIIPSVVAFTDKGQIIVGQHAKDQQLINPQATVYAVKRFLGRTFHSPVVRDLAPRFPFKIKPDKNNEILLEFAGHDHALPEIVAMILSYLKECAEGYLQTPIHRAIMTVPAYFTEKQRAALKRAAALAHLKVELVFHEPTAAALAYGYNKEYEKRILVFDLGGGTFDVSILEVNGNVFEVKGTGGDPFLGGLDFDQRLINHIVSEFEKQHKVSVRDNAIVMQRISNAAENAKIQLSFESKANIHLPYIVEKKGKPLDLSMTIERDKLNELVKDLVEKTLAICEQAIHSMGVLPGDIDDVLLVGGQTRMPYLQQRVQEYFNREPSKGVHPDEAVAAGAALMGHSLELIDGPMLLDMLALPIGVANELANTKGGGIKVQNIFPKLTPLSTRKSFKLSELLALAPQGVLRLCQGEAEEFAANEYIGDIQLQLKLLEADPSEVQVTFELSREGILRILAQVGGVGKVELLQLELSQALPEEFSDQMTVEKSTSSVPVKESRSIFGKFFSKG